LLRLASHLPKQKEGLTLLGAINDQIKTLIKTMGTTKIALARHKDDPLICAAVNEDMDPPL